MFKPRFNQVVAVISWITCAVAAVAVAVAGLANNWEYLPGLVAIAFATWAVLWHPAVLVDDKNVTLVNVLSTVEIPWPSIIQVDTRYALTVITPKHRYSATAAPAPGRLSTAFGKKDAAAVSNQVGSDGRIKPSDLPHTDSGAAAFLIRDRWERLQRENRIELGIADETPVIRHWHTVTIVVLVALIATAGAALALG